MVANGLFCYFLNEELNDIIWSAEKAIRNRRRRILNTTWVAFGIESSDSFVPLFYRFVF